MKQNTTLFLLCAALAMLACHNRDKSAPAPDRTALFYDYKVWAEEGSDSATVMLRYLAGGEEGTALPLRSAALPRLDGAPMTADSAAFTGSFYEAARPLPSFAGEHRIELPDASGKLQAERFLFEPFALAAEVPETVAKRPFTIHLRGLPASADLRLVLIDTSFATADVNEEVSAENGAVYVTAAQLANLAAGPVTLEIIREERQPLKNAPADGRILVTYGLRRQFVLGE